MITTLAVTSPASTRDLTVLDTVKAELGIVGTSDDAYLADLIRQASDLIARFCRRPEGFGRETVTQTWRLDRDPPCLILARDIAPAVASVTEDGTALASTDWLLDGSLLYRLQTDRQVAWTASKVVVSYAAGFALLTDVPYDLERCCIDLVRAGWRGRGRDPALKSMRVPDVLDVSYWGGPDATVGGVPKDIADRLAPYSRWPA
ncbi:gp6 domain containing protein [uncultured Caudovirales phage]|uniref:Gp6 domain containing protein n=1 Tax=uncultured Caudovirales phage TaxID=2100421 RepID=A0A6J5M7D0_9CAUD|nr:gp6 domain containing protein [uncultured Caudovirales phage]